MRLWTRYSCNGYFETKLLVSKAFIASVFNFKSYLREGTANRIGYSAFALPFKMSPILF